LVASQQENEGADDRHAIADPNPEEPKLPLDFVMLKMHEAMEMLFAYDHDPNFVPSADQLLLIEMLHKQIAGYAAISIIIVDTMRQRVNEALSATAPD
jgi:hypothetical protein